jgi:glycosyltransferase involved in cell wall biosynthesis
MKICFYALEHHSLDSGGGIASYLNAIVPELIRLGHEVHIIVKGRMKNTRQLGDGTFLHEFNGGNIHWYLSKLPLIGKHLALPVREFEWSWGFYRHLRNLKKKYRFNLIESSETGNLLTVLFEKKLPLVIRLHGSTYSFEKSTMGAASFGAILDRILQRYSFNRAKGISSPSSFQKKLFEKECNRMTDVIVIPNPVAVDDFTGPQPVTQEVPKIIFYAGRIADVKGIWPLLKAFSQVIKRNPDVRLIMAGAPHVSISRSSIDSFLEGHNIKSKVELPGYIQKDKIKEYYKRCRVYAVPSYYEAFCISAVEAMLYGKPVVASSGTALEEIVEDGVTGILVPPGDDRALTKAFLKLLNDDELTKQMGEAGCEKVLREYQPSFIADKTLKFYEEMIAKTEKKIS